MPTLNEQGSIEWVFEHIPSWINEVVLVDGLSTDLTELVARWSRPDVVVVHQRRPGKGAALRAGFAAASSEIVVMIDADGSTNPSEIHRFVEKLESGADFVKGSRHVAGGGSADFTLLRRAGNKAFVILVNLLYGAHFTDLCYGYCAFWRRHLDALALTADGFEIETQLLLNAVKAGLDIYEVPSFELKRRTGKSNLNAYRDGRRVLATILPEWTGNDSRAQAPVAPIDLQKVEVASFDSNAWLPAGRDRRRVERRRPSHVAAGGHTGPERRRAARRTQPGTTSTVYVVVDQGARGSTT
jgi:glycosyltransferase involved in cell wall biosynthesis